MRRNAWPALGREPRDACDTPATMPGPLVLSRLAAALLLLLGVAVNAAAATVQVGSKRFTESYLLGAIVTETLARAAPMRSCC